MRMNEKRSDLRAISMVLSLCAVVLATPSALHAEPADASSGPAVRDVNARLAARGYPVDPQSDRWSNSSRRYTQRMFIRTGQPNADPSPQDARNLLDSIDAVGGDIPCPAYDAWERATAEEGIEGETGARVAFRGERPDEQLAVFYRRLAECHAWALTAVPREGALSAGQTTPSFPVNRTRLATEIFNAASRSLARASREEVARADYAEPGLLPQMKPSVVRRRLWAATPDADTKPTVAAVQKMNSANLRDACAQLGASSNCAQPTDIRMLIDPATNEPSAYIVEIPHYELLVDLTLPAALADLVLIDGVDAVSESFPELGEEGGASAPFVWLFSDTATPLADIPAHVCDEDESAPAGRCRALDELSEADQAELEQAWKEILADYDRIADIIGWIPQTDAEKRREEQNLARTRQTEIVVVDPGFDNLRNEDTATVSNTCPDAQAEHGPFSCLMEAVQKKNAQNYRLFRLGVGDIDRVGHGLHVAHLIAGAGAGSSKESRTWRGFLGPQTGMRVSYQKFATDPSLSANVAAAVTTQIVNRSYEHDDDCDPRPPQPAGASGASQSQRFPVWNEVATSQSLDKDFKNLRSEDKLTSNRPHFSVISSPCRKGSSDNEKWLDCSGDDPDLACLGRTMLGLGAAPIRRGVRGGGSNLCGNARDAARATGELVSDWVVMDSPDNCVSGPRRYALRDVDIAWLAAPGEKLLSADGRRLGRIIDFGYRQRTGSSMAAAIVSALAARTAAQFGLAMTWGEMKLWMLANATPLSVPFDPETVDLNSHPQADWAQNHRHAGNIIGVANFNRTLNGIPDKVNIWDSCSRTGVQCPDPNTYEVVFVHAALRDQLFGERGVVVALAGDGSDIFAVRRKAERCPEELAPDERSMHACMRVFREKIDEPDACALTRRADKAPCIFAGSYPARLGEQPDVFPVDVSNVASIVGFLPRQEGSLEGCNNFNIGVARPQWMLMNDCGVQPKKWRDYP